MSSNYIGRFKSQYIQNLLNWLNYLILNVGDVENIYGTVNGNIKV